jgi:hypothetical protein
MVRAAGMLSYRTYYYAIPYTGRWSGGARI